jgi:hypothetical protein
MTMQITEQEQGAAAAAASQEQKPGKKASAARGKPRPPGSGRGGLLSFVGHSCAVCHVAFAPYHNQNPY